MGLRRHDSKDTRVLFSVAPTIDIAPHDPFLSLDMISKWSKVAVRDRLRITHIVAPGRLQQEKTTGRESSDQSQEAMSRK